METIGGFEPARSLIVQALKSGKHVVTANKEVIAHHQDVPTLQRAGGFDVQDGTEPLQHRLDGLLLATTGGGARPGDDRDIGGDDGGILNKVGVRVIWFSV